MTHHSNMAPPWLDKGAAGGPGRAQRWIVRTGKTKGEGLYLAPVGNDGVRYRMLDELDVESCAMVDERGAQLWAEAMNGRCIPMLTAEQAKQKAAATALRALSASLYEKARADRSMCRLGLGRVAGIEEAAGIAAKEAEKAWPARGRGRGHV